MTTRWEAAPIRHPLQQFPAVVYTLQEPWDKADDCIQTFTIITTGAIQNLAHICHLADCLHPALNSRQLIDLVRKLLVGHFGNA